MEVVSEWYAGTAQLNSLRGAVHTWTENSGAVDTKERQWCQVHQLCCSGIKEAKHGNFSMGKYMLGAIK